MARFISACVGNAIVRHLRGVDGPVHPRVCGERWLGWRETGVSYGSSPRVRGTLAYSHDYASGFRFIPACAGNATCDRWATSPATVHPRVCGERCADVRLMGPYHGSSPRVRGTRKHRSLRIDQQRFIPACAGNAVAFRRDLHGVGGSSPRVRGTPTRTYHAVSSARFIPACAGNARGK